MSAAPPCVVTVIDPSRGDDRVYDLRVADDGHVVLTPADDSATSDVYVSPGWADVHAHVFDGTTQISVAPDRVGLDQGVHVVGDAGSAGAATVRGFIDYVLPAVTTSVRLWLNIGSHGLVHLRETADPSFIDVDATIAAIHAYRDRICGIKVRSSGAIVGAMGLQPLQLARLVAEEVGLPLLVHIGEAPPPISDVLNLLRPGDVVTHCYHGKAGHPWRRDGTPTPALQAALERGVQLDVGHGAASFDARVARAAIAAGYPPHTISTDIHVRNIGGPVYSLAAVMTKLLACGMSLREVVTGVTTAARRTLGAEQPWRADDGVIRHATVFRVSDVGPPTRCYVDAAGNPVDCPQHIVAVATITDGHFRPVESG